MASTVQQPITIPYPTVEGDLDLRIEAGACRLRISASDTDEWITGRYHDASGSIDVESTVEGNRTSIRVGRSAADVFGFFSGLPELALQIGKRQPFSLSVAAGASENHLELGGLPVTRLEISHGAGSMDVSFSTPTTAAATLLKFGVGAGRTNVEGIGNVRFSDLIVEGGAANCRLDFSGMASPSGSVRLSTAMAAVELRIPRSLPAEVTSENLLGRPDADSGFTRRGNAWINQAALEKATQLRVRSSMVMGHLTLTTIP